MTSLIEQTGANQGLPINYTPLELEKQVREFWVKNCIREKLEALRYSPAIKGNLGYVEGPPTLNGIPHIGHARGRIMKDIWYRWKTMEGYYMPFWAGWDCQGLPVELEVEKLLGVSNKLEMLERVGMERFVAECKNAIMRYHIMWLTADSLLGVAINQEKAYWTYKDEYIEREWQILKRAWDQGLLEEGHYVVAYCPGCQTSLSSAEVGYEGSYREVEDPSFHFKFKVSGTKNEYFLVWTTMPFTVITDTMLAVQPKAEYVKVQVDSEVWIMVKQRVEPVMAELEIKNYKVLEVIDGQSLEGVAYEYPLKDIIPQQAENEKKHVLVHKVICEEFVDVNTATGVVHLSPGNGEEDYWAATRRGVPIYAPFDDEAKFTKDAGVFAGVFARAADKLVVEEMRSRNAVVALKKVKHEYPHCWRSRHKIIWIARKEYFLRTDKIKDKVLEAFQQVNYFYDEPKNRFMGFLSEGKSWCISRERIWGTPLPIWSCSACGNKHVVANKKELISLAQEEIPADFELHKPWVDRVTLKCSKCSGVMKREDFVLDTWHNSGAAPYARFTDEEVNQFVPTAFLTEGIDQTRGWANSLLLEHVIQTGKAEAPFKAFLFQGLTQDAKGRKMSKSVGNTIETIKLLETNSADLCRYYLMRKCNPIDFMNFDMQELNRRSYQVLSTLYHLSRFFLQNAQFDKYNPTQYNIDWATTKGTLIQPADKWMLSKMQQTIQQVTENLEKREFNTALAALDDFVIETLSRLYVPMIRKELWTDDHDTLERRQTIYALLHHTLKTVTLLFNPITPYLSEMLYQKIYRQLEPELPETINLEKWPTQNKTLQNKPLEDNFDTMLKIASISYATRQQGKLKRRWPLSKAIIVAPQKILTALQQLEAIFQDLINVKTIEYATATPDYVTAENWVSTQENDTIVHLSNQRDETLLGEGIMRDLARRVQALRKEIGFTPTDILEAAHITELDTETMQLLKPHLEEMANLIRTQKVYLLDKANETENTKWHESELDGKKIHISIQ